MQQLYPEYAGMTYEQASREADRLIIQGWFKNIERLKVLHKILWDGGASVSVNAGQT